VHRLALGAIGAVCIPLSALQSQRAFRAGPPDAELRDEFTRVSAIRELSGGRVLVADAREKRVVLGTWPDGRTRQLGRVGDGPQEYRAPSRLLAAGGDSTYIIDTQARRWILMVGDSFGRSPLPERALRLTSYEPPIRGMDATGRFLVAVSLSPIRRTFDSDSVLLVIARIGAVNVDTIAKLRGRGSERGIVTRSDRGIPTQHWLYSPFGVEEQALMLADGWIAVAYLDPFRVDWRTPDGEWIRGVAIDVPRRAATENEKRFAVAREWALLKPLPTTSDFRGWPEFVPAFMNDAMMGLTDGRVAIARMPTVAEPEPSYDIVDRRGALVGRITVEPRQRIAAFGAKHFYVVTKDEMDVERVSRHELPRF
jgi:hypothetical protein